MTIIFSLLLIIIDQIVKHFISKMTLYSSTIIIPNFFNITYVKNTGAAFSILSDNTLLIIIITLAILFFLYKSVLKTSKYKLSKILLLGGIISNLIDRILRGYVVDFLDFNIFGYDFPIFNIADICIVIGCILLIYETFKEK